MYLCDGGCTHVNTHNDLSLYLSIGYLSFTYACKPIHLSIFLSTAALGMYAHTLIFLSIYYLYMISIYCLNFTYERRQDSLIYVFMYSLYLYTASITNVCMRIHSSIHILSIFRQRMKTDAFISFSFDYGFTYIRIHIHLLIYVYTIYLSI